MKTGIISILGAILLVLTPSLPASAQGSPAGTITITMTGVETRVEIELSPTEWALGEVTENTEYKTDPEATWCTITNEGNVNVDLGINGENAKWLLSPASYRWLLSADETNNKHSEGYYDEYALWYHMAYDEEATYTPIISESAPMKKGVENVTLDVDSQKQFGLKLLTPESYQSFYLGHPASERQMETHITISVVSAP